MREDKKFRVLEWVVFVAIIILSAVFLIVGILLTGWSFLREYATMIYFGLWTIFALSSISAIVMYRKSEREKALAAEERFKTAALEEAVSKLKGIIDNRSYSVVQEATPSYFDELKLAIKKSITQVVEEKKKQFSKGLLDLGGGTLPDIVYMSSFNDVDAIKLLEYLVTEKRKISEDPELSVFQINLNSYDKTLESVHNTTNCEVRATYISQIFDPIILCGVDIFLRYNGRWLYLCDEEFGRLDSSVYSAFLRSLYNNSIPVTYDRKRKYIAQVSSKLSQHLTTKINENGFAHCANEVDLWLSKPKDYPELVDNYSKYKDKITYAFKDFEAEITEKSSKIIACWPLTPLGLELGLHKDEFIKKWLTNLIKKAKENPDLEVTRYLFVSGKRVTEPVNGGENCVTVLSASEDYPGYDKEVRNIVSDFFPDSGKIPDNYKTYAIITNEDLMNELSITDSGFASIYQNKFLGNSDELYEDLVSNWIFFYSPGLSVLQYEDLIKVEKGGAEIIFPLFYYHDTKADIENLGKDDLEIGKKCHRHIIYIRTLRKFLENARGKNPVKERDIYIFGLYEPGSPFYESVSH
ncbi:MAG: hypothetical protein PVH29_13830 [Candidatus Zixiibacteriota bacterium]|jgi:hypothetical protein